MKWSAEYLEKVHQTLNYNLQHNAYYYALWQKNNLATKDIKDFSDLQIIPTTDKETVQNNIAAFTCVASKDIIEYTTTSGTLGFPLAIPLTENDLIRLANNEQHSFEKMQLTADDTVQLMLTLDRQFMAGMAYYSGLRNIGCSIIRTGPGLPAMQWETIQNFKSRVLVGVPSFILKLIDYAKQHDIDYLNTSVAKILVIGESLYDEKLQPTILMQRINSLWPNVMLFNTYASTEMQTAYTECKYHNGLHENNNLIITEIIDDLGNQVELGQVGEICITTLGIEGLPLIRYRTGDMTIAYGNTCQCGHQGLSIGGIIARKKQLLKIKGTTLYPNNISNVLNNITAVSDYCIVAMKDHNSQDDLIIYYTSVDNTNLDEYLRLQFKNSIKIKLNVAQIDSDSLIKMQFPNNSRKQYKFIDKR